MDKTVDIPKIFKCDLTGAHFQCCIQCEYELMLGDRPYLIEKAIKPYGGYDSYATIFEYAVCVDCAQQMKGMLSAESMQKLMEYFQQKVDFNGHRQAMMEQNPDDPMKWIAHCMVTGKPVSELIECQIYASCLGDQLVFSEFPYMISGGVLDEIVGLLSAETLDELNDFKDTVGPSEFQDLLQSGPKVFI